MFVHHDCNIVYSLFIWQVDAHIYPTTPPFSWNTDDPLGDFFVSIIKPTLRVDGSWLHYGGIT